MSLVPRHILAFFFLALGCSSPTWSSSAKASAGRTLPVTTNSIPARELFEKAMTDYENFYLERANVEWRDAAKADPDFALAQAWIAFNSRDPLESASARARAKALAPKVSPGERLMITWIVSVQEGNFLPGIAAMNDMLALYPKDKRLYFLAGNWLMGENGYEQAQKLFERALTVDKNYPAALNNLGYCYAHEREFDKAFSAMERYVAALPNEPNPQDSYGEILRQAGHFDEALEHYRAALKINPAFVFSQLGLGDTYALMGNQTQARAEYDKAIATADNEADRLDYSLQKAITWVREKNLPEADKAFTSLAQESHARGLDLHEAQAYRNQSLYQADDVVALRLLQSAEDALEEQANLSQTERSEEMSRILRYRTVRAQHAGNKDLTEKPFQQLQTLANGSRSSVVQSSLAGTDGAQLMAAGKYAEAADRLEEDKENPYSLELLSDAYFKTGAAEKMHEIEVRLRAMNLPTMEQALVVPAARSRMPRIPGF
jgi:tetratricopeptide (TPR) repeat protein